MLDLIATRLMRAFQEAVLLNYPIVVFAVPMNDLSRRC